MTYFKPWAWSQHTINNDEEDVPIDGRERVKKLKYLLDNDNLKTFFPLERDLAYQARFKLFHRGGDDYMTYIECIEFLMSINIIMSEKILHLLYTTMSEEHQGDGITYKDI